MTSTEPRGSGRRWGPMVADLACVLALAVGGKSSHEASEPFWVVLAIVWPFALAAASAHLWLISRGRQTRRVWPEGVSVLAATYVIGMLLRALSGRGLAPGFLIVAGVFLAATMLGWRLMVQLATSIRARRAT